MNPQTNTFQQQYPLSPKKIWKKMIPNIIGLAFLWLIIVAAGSLVFLVGLNMPVAASTVTIIVLVATIIAAGFFAVYFWYYKVYIRTYFYVGEDHYVTIRKGVFAPQEIHVQYQKIQDVYVDQDILDRIMGLYDVHIASATAASSMEAHIDGVEASVAEPLKHFFLAKMAPGAQNMGQQGQSGDVNPAGSLNQNSGGQNNGNIKAVKLSEEISSNKYPLTTKWFIVQLLTRVVSTAIFITIISLGLLAKANDVNGVPALITLLIYVAILVISFIVNIISLLLWKKNYAFNFTENNIFYRTGVISLSESHMPYSSVQDVSVKQGVLERLVGLATVRIENASQITSVQMSSKSIIPTGVVIPGLSLADANHITELLKTQILGRNSAQFGL